MSQNLFISETVQLFGTAYKKGGEIKPKRREEEEGGFVHKMIRVRNKSKNWTNSLEDISLVKKFKFTCCVSNFTLEQLQIMFAFFNPKLSVKIKFA